MMPTNVTEVLSLLLDVSIKAALLAGVAGAGLLVFRVRDSNARHRVWATVLLAMLVLPVLVSVMPQVPVPMSVYPQLSGWRLQAQNPVVMAVAPEPQSALQPSLNEPAGVQPATITNNMPEAMAERPAG